MVVAKVDSIEELKYVKDKLENGIKQANKKTLSIILLNVIAEVKESDPVFKVRVFEDGNNGHFETFLNYADMKLNCLYSDIEFIANQLRSDEMNAKVLIRMLEKMILSDLNLKYVDNYIKRASEMQEGSYEIGELRLSDRVPGEYTLIDEE